MPFVFGDDTVYIAQNVVGLIRKILDQPLLISLYARVESLTHF